MPTELSNAYAASFQTIEESEEEDKKQQAADEFARAIEESSEIAFSGMVGFNGATPVERREIVFDDSNLAALSQTVSDLMTLLEDIGLISVG